MGPPPDNRPGRHHGFRSTRGRFVATSSTCVKVRQPSFPFRYFVVLLVRLICVTYPNCPAIYLTFAADYACACVSVFVVPRSSVSVSQDQILVMIWNSSESQV